MVLRIVLLGLVALAGPVLAGEADVTFVNSDRYTDGVLDSRDPDLAPRELKRHFERLAQRYLASGEKLTVEIMDIDLAGRPAIAPRLSGARILTSVTWPSIKLHYRLEGPVSGVEQADELVSDLSYQTRGNHYFSDDPLRYEKQMLDDWFARRFVTRQSPR